MDPVKGEVWELVHDRKGRMEVRVESCDPEWLDVTALQLVVGLSGDWDAGDRMSLRRSMVRLLRRIDLPKVL